MHRSKRCLGLGRLQIKLVAHRMSALRREIGRRVEGLTIIVASHSLVEAGKLCRGEMLFFFVAH